MPRKSTPTTVLQQSSNACVPPCNLLGTASGIYSEVHTPLPIPSIRVAHFMCIDKPQEHIAGERVRACTQHTTTYPAPTCAKQRERQRSEVGPSVEHVICSGMFGLRRPALDTERLTSPVGNAVYLHTSRQTTSRTLSLSPQTAPRPLPAD